MNITISIIILTAAIATTGLLLHQAIKDIYEDMDRLGECHNRLCELAKEICDSLNESGIPAPEIRTTEDNLEVIKGRNNEKR